MGVTHTPLKRARLPVPPPGHLLLTMSVSMLYPKKIIKAKCPVVKLIS